jgi:hypothetical protein
MDSVSLTSKVVKERESFLQGFSSVDSLAVFPLRCVGSFLERNAAWVHPAWQGVNPYTHISERLPRIDRHELQSRYARRGGTVSVGRS